MSNSKRTDVHRPGALIPADYRILFSYAHATTIDGWPVPGENISLLCAQRAGRAFYAASDAHSGEADPIRDENGRPYPMAAIHKGRACDSCGAWHVYGSVYLHEPTGEAIAIGWQCAEKVDLFADHSEQARLRGNRDAARKAVQNKLARRRALRTFVAENRQSGLLRDLRADHYIVQDIRAKLIRYGSISEKQAALVSKLAREAREKASRPAEVHVPAPIQEGRQTVEGTVVSCKIHESAYGDQLKMTVKVEAEGGTWLAWGTCPSSLGSDLELGQDGLRGCRVRFDAKLKAGRDPHFALFSRPTKAAVTALGQGQREQMEKMEAEAAEYQEQAPEWAAGQQVKVARMRELVA